MGTLAAVVRVTARRESVKKPKKDGGDLRRPR